MKFVCERCQTRYSIADEKVRQKILKIRCKTCENVITVRDATLGAAQPSAVSSGAVSRPPSGKLPTLPPSSAAEWYVAVNGVQAGPITRAEAAKRLILAKPDDEAYVWKEDFDSWKEAKDVPAIAQEMTIQRGRTSLPPARPAPVPPVPKPLPSRGVPAVGAPSGSSPSRAAAPVARASQSLAAIAEESEEEERTQIQTLDAAILLAPASDAGSQPRAAAGSSDFPWASSKPEAGALATALGGGRHAPASGSDPLAAVSAQPLSAAAASGPVPAAAGPAEAGLSKLHGLPGFFSRNPMVKYAAASLAVVGVLVGVVLATMSGDAETPVAIASPAESPASVAPADPTVDAEKMAREQAEQRFKSTVGTSVAQDRPAPRRVLGMARAHAKPAPAPAAPPPTGSLEPAPLTAEQEAASRRFAQNERKVTGFAATRAPTGGGGEVSQGQISAVVKRKEHQDAIRACYERALKRNEQLRTGRIEVVVSIGASGIVKSVSVNGPAEFGVLEPCIKQAVRRWPFPSSAEEYGTSFPFILQGSL